MNVPIARDSTTNTKKWRVPLVEKPKNLGIEWDAENRLLAVNQGTLRSEFTYDGQSRRVRIVEKSGVTVTSDRRFLWCASEICEERSSSGGTVAKRYFAEGVQQSAQAYFYSRDHLGSIRELSDGVAATRARYDYDVYGKRTLVAGDQASDFGFTGHYEHSTSGTALTLYRAYDASIGRWLSEDPIGLAAGTNLYSYVGNMPLVATDPLGLVHSEGGPWHPDEWFGLHCYETDTCPVLQLKISSLSDTIRAHQKLGSSVRCVFRSKVNADSSRR
jgi:RHS repeat-associated protein